jgi:hypothetical protein|tara:strand:+ start:366 stop:743 length:378 start_codon:yes stop_codon:yes gene_type:complete
MKNLSGLLWKLFIYSGIGTGVLTLLLIIAHVQLPSNIFGIIWVLWMSALSILLMLVSFSAGQYTASLYKSFWKARIIFTLVAGFIFGCMHQFAITKFDLLLFLLWVTPGIVGVILIEKGKGIKDI